MSKFWDKFDNLFDKMGELFEELPDYIDEQLDKAGQKRDGMFRSVSVTTSTTINNGKKVEVKTTNGKTTVRVNGKEYVERSE
jgi:carbonic anhydrase